MALQDTYNAMIDSTLQQRVAAAVVGAANAILNEETGTDNHANRLTWARQASTSPEAALAMAQRMMAGVMGNATIAAAGIAATDADIQFVVNSLVSSPAWLDAFLG